MAITGDIIHREILEISDNRGGSRTKVETKTTLSNHRIAEWDKQITASMVDTLIWDGGDALSPIASFDYLNLKCDVDLEIEFTSSLTARSFTVQLKANQPFHLFADDTMDGTGSVGDGFGGTAAIIDQIAVREGTAKVAAGQAGELHIIMSKAA